MPETRVKVYRTPGEQRADEADALSHGWTVATREAQPDGTLRVTYQKATPSEWAAPSPPAPPAPPVAESKKKKGGNPVVGCAVLLVILGVVAYGYLFPRSATELGGPPGLAATATPRSTERWSVSLSQVTVSSRVAVGDPVQVRFHAKNRGPGAAPMVMRIGGPSGKAEFSSCSPRCRDRDEVLGTRYLDFPQLKGGGEDDYVITFRTLEVGRIDWSISPDDQPEELWTATTVVTQ